MSFDNIVSRLKHVRNAFQSAGFDIRVCGGAVRDIMLGVDFHDVDLCSDANPEEQIAIYKANGFAYYETGLKHGTITVRINDENYEITSLRTETDHDGRHATVHYTRNWLEDLGRRDLTFNAMAMTFEGELIDPYNGLADLRSKKVRFVGNPDERMREDYLRILRWLRFHGRFAQGRPLDPITMEAAIRNAEGLKGISRERVWMEMAKIVTGNDAEYLVQNIYDMHLAEMIGLPKGDTYHLKRQTKNPVTLVTSMLMHNPSAVEGLTQDWKWSAEERDLALFLAQFINKTTDFFYTDTNYKRLVAHDGYSKEWVIELALMHKNKVFAASVKDWEVPVFPVKGVDLIKAGVMPGPQMGEKLREMKKAWADSFYTRTKESLMKMVWSK